MNKVNKEDKKPDSYVENAKLLPYGSNIGAPSIKIENVNTWRQKNIERVNKNLKTKFEELESEYQKLIEEYDLNQMVYSAHYNFEPIIGEIYHLYRNKEKIFLSLIKPSEWDVEHLGGFKLDSNNKWNRI